MNYRKLTASTLILAATVATTLLCGPNGGYPDKHPETHCGVGTSFVEHNNLVPNKKGKFVQQTYWECVATDTLGK